MRNSFFKYLLLRGVNFASRSELESETLPYTFYTQPQTLKNYRIYGNTVNGESVGDRTENLFDISTITEGKYISTSGDEAKSFSQIQENMLNHTDFINISNDTVYSLTATIPYGVTLENVIAFCWFDDNKSFISRNTKTISVFNVYGYSFSAVSPSNAVYLIVNFIGYVDGTTYMLNSGSEPLPYEPYSYRVPVTVTNGVDTQTTNLYLPKQIKMVGDEAEYIDFREQKQHFADGTSADVTLPAIPILFNTNTLSVGTTVQPSKIYLQGNISEIETVSAQSLQASPRTLDVMPIDRDEFQINDISEMSVEEIPETENLETTGDEENAE